MKRTRAIMAIFAISGFLASSAWAVPATAGIAPLGLTTTEYGYSVAISGSIAAVGAPGEHHGSGTVYIFAHSRKGWRFQTKIEDPAHLAQDAFGWSVAVSS